MANEQNLTHKLTASEQRKGGRKSGQVRREKKTVQDLLKKLLSEQIKDHKELAGVAMKAGITKEQTIKELAIAMCFINTLKKGDIEKLQRMAELLGEEPQYEDSNKDVEETLVKIKECAYEYRDKSQTS